MPQMRKALKLTGWTVGGIAALGVALYLIALAINVRDAKPSPTAVRFEQLYRDRPTIADGDNAFVYVTGFDTIDRESVDRSPEIKAFLHACRLQGTDCLAAFDASDNVFASWMATESRLLEQYRKLLTHRGWREVIPTDVAEPFPLYGSVINGQKLFLLEARSLVAAGDFAGIQSRLDDDMRFWRMVLASSDILLSKIVAASALKRNFEWGSLILRKLPPDHVSEAVPHQWRVALSDSELSMLRCFVGEWKFMTASLRKEIERDEAPDGQTTLASLSSFGAKPLFQMQASANQQAEYLSRIVETLSVPLDRYEAATNKIDDLATDAFPLQIIYNPVGKMALRISAPLYAPYARRVADIEGVRRAALAAATLREKYVKAADVGAALKASHQRNPYNNNPFAWDAQSGAIVFQGLETGKSGLHHIYY